MSRVALGVEYDGTAYCGWQIQPHAPSVQATLNAAISVVANQPATCVAAGRTDTGVHATGQVVHFDAGVERDPRSWLLGINSNLPDDVAVFGVWPVDEAFHARYSAIGRSYRYVILNRPTRSPLERDRAWWLRGDLDIDAMAGAASRLLGKHDFSSFRASGCQAHSPVRELRRLDVSCDADRITVDCAANAFLHHMVRNIVGTLVRVARGEADADWVAGLVDRRDRRLAGITAPAHGLTLTRVDYPEPFEHVGRVDPKRDD